LKLTLDSSEPLEHAMRVVGALYGVTLSLSSDGQEATKPAKKNSGKPANAKKRTARKKTSATRKALPVAAAADAEPTQEEQAVALGSAGSPSNADLRTWARHNGFTLSDRGRVPAAIVTAYRSAHGD
jgi:hypothetical protein